jgi:hypothetical protein
MRYSLEVTLQLLSILVFRGFAIGQSRISQTYPLASTTTPFTFANPVYTGNFLESKQLYIHAEFSSSSTKIVGLDASGNILFNQGTASMNVKGVALITDYLYSFGATLNIEVLQLLYNTPTYIQISSSSLSAHNLNLNRAFTDQETAEVNGQIFLTTKTGGKLYMFSNSAAFGSPQITGILANFNAASMNALEFLPGGLTLIAAGATNQLVIVSRSSLTSIFSLPISSGVLEIKRDKLTESNLANSDLTLIDYIESTTNKLHRMRIDFSVNAAIEVVTTSFVEPVNNLIQFPNVLYLAVSHGTSLEVFTRLKYISKYTITLTNAHCMHSIAGVRVDNYVYSFSAVDSVSLRFLSFQVNLDFCGQLNSDGTCDKCISGYQLSSLNIPNRCILTEEYPPRYGVRAASIDSCIDTKCLSCIGNYLKCDVCSTGLYINSDNFQCTTLEKNDFYGYDPANNAVIRRCTDRQCLDCKLNYQICIKCPEQYYNLIKGVCVIKNNDMYVSEQWLDTVTSAAYFRLSQPLSINMSNLMGKTLRVSVTDYQGLEFTDFNKVVLSLLGDNRTVKAYFGFKSTLYGGRILFTQISNSSVFYGPTSYMPVSTQVVFDRVSIILDDTYYSILSIEAAIALGYWVLMMVSILLGFFSHTWMATSLMRTISYCTVFAHLNDAILHSSDTLLDILANVSVPIFPKTLFKSESPTQPPSNFMKRHFDYYTIDGIYNFGGSLLFFLLTSIPMVLLIWLSRSTISRVVARVKLNHGKIDETDMSESLILKSLLNRVFGGRFILGVIDACSPSIIQYSILNILFVESAGTGILFTPLVMLFMFGVMFCRFRFTNDFLQIQSIKLEKLREADKEALVKRGNASMASDSPMNASEQVDFTFEAMKVGREQVRIFDEDRKSEGTGLNPAMPDWTSWGYTKEEQAVFELSSLNYHLEVDSTVYPIMGVSLEGFTHAPKSPRSFLYFLPLVEQVNILASQFVLVRFSGSGMTQIFTLMCFEALLLMMYIRLRPYSSMLNLCLVVGYKAVVLMIYFIKLWNCREFDSESTRQRLVDNAMLIGIMVFVAYSAFLSVYGAIKGLMVLGNWGHEVKAERIRIVKMISTQIKAQQDRSIPENRTDVSRTIRPLQISHLIESKIPQKISEQAAPASPQPVKSTKKLARPRKVIKTVSKAEIQVEPTKVKLPPSAHTKSHANKVSKSIPKIATRNIHVDVTGEKAHSKFCD